MFFQVVIDRLRPGAPADYVDGLVIGVTTSLPTAPELLPEFADSLPQSWSVGYTGLAVTPDSQIMHEVDWNPTSLQPGDDMGLFVTADGLITLFVNGMPQVTLPGCPVPSDAQLYGFVDLLGTVWSVVLKPSRKYFDYQRPRESGENGNLTRDDDLVHQELQQADAETSEAEESDPEAEESDSEIEDSHWHLKDDVHTADNSELDESDSEAEESDSKAEVFDWHLKGRLLTTSTYTANSWPAASDHSEARESESNAEETDTESDEFF